jgi:hypothetical protein
VRPSVFSTRTASLPLDQSRADKLLVLLLSTPSTARRWEPTASTAHQGDHQQGTRRDRGRRLFSRTSSSQARRRASRVRKSRAGIGFVCLPIAGDRQSGRGTSSHLKALPNSLDRTPILEDPLTRDRKPCSRDGRGSSEKDDCTDVQPRRGACPSDVLASSRGDSNLIPRETAAERAGRGRRPASSSSLGRPPVASTKEGQCPPSLETVVEERTGRRHP